MADTEHRGTRLVSFMPVVIVLMGTLMVIGVLAATTTAAKIALVVVILAVGLAFSAAMLKNGRTDHSN